MTDLPKQVDKRVRREIAALTRPWKLVKKRDHYFLHIEGHPLVCVANNSSKHNGWLVKRTLEELRRVTKMGMRVDPK